MVLLYIFIYKSVSIETDPVDALTGHAMRSKTKTTIT